MPSSFSTSKRNLHVYSAKPRDHRIHTNIHVSTYSHNCIMQLPTRIVYILALLACHITVSMCQTEPACLSHEKNCTDRN